MHKLIKLLTIALFVSNSSCDSHDDHLEDLKQQVENDHHKEQQGKAPPTMDDFHPLGTLRYKHPKFFKYGYTTIRNDEWTAQGHENLDSYLIGQEFMMLADGHCEHGWNISQNMSKDRAAFSKEFIGEIGFHMQEDHDFHSAFKKSLEEHPYDGKSTLVMAEFDENDDNTLITQVLGNSGYMLLRPKKGTEKKEFEMIFRSVEEYVSKDVPRCLEKHSDFPIKTLAEYGGVEKRHQVEEGDMVIMYTDGISDNLQNKDIIKCVDDNIEDVFKHRDAADSLDALVHCIALLSNANSHDGSQITPYSEAHCCGKDHKPDTVYPEGHGGRKDDMTILVGIIEDHHHTKVVQQSIMTNYLLKRGEPGYYEHRWRWNLMGATAKSTYHEDFEKEDL